MHERSWLSASRMANATTHRAYASAVDRTIDRLGRDRPLTGVTDAEIGTALADLWATSAPATWIRNRAPVRSKGGAVEWVYWDSGTAHLLLRLPDGSTRTHGPLFLS
ncbi:hypothetical protein [Nonomuraea zeae]|uniref:hypothetical protein n=1 Tax=Nonomuraea zeae TaxID=1642303 RepID=UPI001F101564|nr:hypothetical protein [Nonomuraea zeae]